MKETYIKHLENIRKYYTVKLAYKNTHGTCKNVPYIHFESHTKHAFEI